jgi:sulfur transfer protein SufE
MAEKVEGGPPTTASKVKLQMQKMQDANAKYKNLLKLAKERIHQQDDELQRAKGEILSFPDFDMS